VWEEFMIAKLVATAALAVAVSTTAQTDGPKHGGILHIYHRETPPSLSIHEEATYSVNVPAMGLFNNLVIYDQHKPQNSRLFGPASRRSTRYRPDAVSRLARTHPALPAPTMI
jgi:hypothetical protein